MAGAVSNEWPRIARGVLPLAVEGTFKPWAIEIGHSKLLLRGLIGDPEDTEPLRVFDVLFQDVSRICLADRYSDIDLRMATEGERDSEVQRIDANWRRSNMYLVKRGAATDYVVAGRVFWAEVAIHPGVSSPLLAEVVAADVAPLIYYFE